MQNVIKAFSDEQASSLTGLSKHQLRHWDKIGFFQPAMAHANRSVALSRVYSFSDLVELQVLRTLRNDHKCSLQHLKGVKKKLEEIGEQRWSNTILYVLDKRVVVYDEETDQLEDILSSQRVLKIPLRIVKADMRDRIKELWVRPEELVGSFQQKRNVVHNATVISGTRVPVSTIRDFIDEGYSDIEIIAEFPTIAIADVIAVREEIAA
ncbi:hypothetical protein LOKVESSMR4R_03305 [Yoonia vestfoldensis]|uniref:HTH merR-type domain-containing protein n=2 Tax=Yoonia vestfoldensis TaxID=245188 RepID=A0A1Y0EGL4_9RHOB|nr:hypothetical protein LOKVESSMR4R_03305 [Yoonia vestfoldensis]